MGFLRLPSVASLLRCFYEAAVEFNRNLGTLTFFFAAFVLVVVCCNPDPTSDGLVILLFALVVASHSPAQGVIRWG
jgi:hypothetical protein